MRFLSKKKQRLPSRQVDAVAEIEKHQAQIDGRSKPDLTGAVKPVPQGAKAFAVLLFMVGALSLGLMVWQSLRQSASSSRDGSSAAISTIRNVLPGLTLTPAPPAISALEPTPAPTLDTLPELSTPPAYLPGLAPIAESGLFVDPITARRLSSGLQSEQEKRHDSSESERREQDAETGAMSDRLRPVRLNAARASMLGNRDMWITQGAMIDCVQDPKFVSAQTGMVTCHATRDVRSTSGRVVLIDAGTRFVGYQQGVLAHGQPRIGIIWSRLETPQGVVMHLDSPGTGPLGEAGLDGHIDTHFAARFGAAILISLISDVGDWAAAQAGSNGRDTIRLDSSREAAGDAVTTVLENSINIAPTLYRNQGGRIGIYVARDLDFSDVYALRPVR